MYIEIHLQVTIRHFTNKCNHWVFTLGTNESLGLTGKNIININKLLNVIFNDGVNFFWLKARLCLNTELLIPVTMFLVYFYFLNKCTFS